MKCPVPAWWSQYINRVPNDRFFKVFKCDVGSSKTDKCKLYYRDLPWEGHESIEILNAHDHNKYIHRLEVILYEEGPLAGRIRSAWERHDMIFHTTSDWRDHACTEPHYDVRPPTDKEIAEYIKILNETTTSDIDLVAIDLLIAKSAAEDEFDWGYRAKVGDPYSPVYYLIEQSNGCEVCAWLENLIPRIQQAYTYLESLLHGGILLDYVDLKEFYDGMDFEGLKKALLHRFLDDCSNCLEVIGMTKTAWEAMLKVRLEECLRGKFKRNVNDERNYMISQCSSCGKAAGGGCHLYFFNRKRRCLGCVAQNGNVFDAEGNLRGHITENGEVFDATSKLVARVDGIHRIECMAEEYEDECRYFLENRSGCLFNGVDLYSGYCGFAREIVVKRPYGRRFEYRRETNGVDYRCGAIPLLMKK